MELEIEISRLGAQGDGVAEGPEGPIFVPFTLPGERVKVAVDPESDHARLVEILEPSRKRVAPVCPHFGECGGCALQHMEADAYLSWKRDQAQGRGGEAPYRSAAGGGQASPLAAARPGPFLAITAPARMS